MGNSKANPVAPLTAVEEPVWLEFGSEQGVEQTRDFLFAVTWVTLFAHLDLIEATGPRPRVEIPAPTLALAPVSAAPLMEQRAARDPQAGLGNAAWEMVVPKMIRSGPKTFLPADSAERSGKKPKLL